MADSTLKNRCHVNTNIDTDTFVGIKCANNEVTINFPLGFKSEDNDKGLRKDILLLLNILSKNTEKKESEINENMAYADVSLPIQAYLYIISDFYDRGYYKERENTYEVSKRGKINWGKTVKTQKAYIQDSDIYYLDFVTKKKTVNDDELITLIHEYCVHESFDKLGWLFTSFVPERPRVKFHKRLFIRVIKNKLSTIFNDKNRELFRNMLAVITSLGDDGSATTYKYGTSRFEYVWESLIDKAYGIKNKDDYFPKTRWLINDKRYENSSLEPDTIMLWGEKVYVLDAKYYKYGWTGSPSHLPESTSINKQITYGEYIAESEEFRKRHGLDSNPVVYNAFIMPYDSYGVKFHTETDIHYIGSAISDWKSSDGTKPHEEIAGILLDVKNLMKNHSKSDDRILELAALIERSISKS